MVAFIAACSTTPKGTADSSGSGSSGTSSIDPSSGDAAILEDLINTPLGPSSVSESASASASIEPGSQEDLIINVGDRVFFAYDSAELDADAQELLL
jgi:peptidoglycan-associated lipoprotein